MIIRRNPNDVGPKKDKSYIFFKTPGKSLGSAPDTRRGERGIVVIRDFPPPLICVYFYPLIFFIGLSMRSQKACESRIESNPDADELFRNVWVDEKISTGSRLMGSR